MAENSVKLHTSKTEKKPKTPKKSKKMTDNLKDKSNKKLDSKSPKLSSSTKVSTSIQGSTLPHPRTVVSNQKNSKSKSKSIKKHPSASVALAKTMEDEAFISTSLKNSYIANIALYRNSSVNTSFHTSSRTSETDSSSENKDKKLSKLPTNLLETNIGARMSSSCTTSPTVGSASIAAINGNINKSEKSVDSSTNSAFRRFHSRSSSVPRSTDF